MATTITLNKDGSTLRTTDWEALIKQEIAAKFDHDDVAQTYSYLIRSGYQQWTMLNSLIIERYGKSGFKRIKQLAWKRIEADREHNHGT